VADPVNLLALGDYNAEYLSHREIDGALKLFPAQCDWVGTDTDRARDLDGVDGVWLLPGTPYRDDSAAFSAIRHCLRTDTPFLGTCGGFQYACVELVRERTAVEDPAHAELDPLAANPVIAPLACALNEQTRPVSPVAGTYLAAMCGTAPFEGFHFCGYGLSAAFVPVLEAAGVVVSAHAPDVGVEAVELPGHSFFLATAFQPQIGASDSRTLHPVIVSWLAAAARRAAVRPEADLTGSPDPHASGS
jgi:CTP synthase (UTP-ammonia lyase)